VSAATYAAAQILRILPRVRLSRAVGRLCDAQLPQPIAKAVQNLYIKAYRVEMADVDPRGVPFASFDAFFTRALRSGARAISTEPVVSPADGRVAATGPIDAGSRIFVKGCAYDTGELVGDDRDAARYMGGSFSVIYLSPRDYHRVHSPVDGRIELVRSLGSDLYPVNPIGERHVPQLFVRNKRVAIAIETEQLGRVTIVMVGAVIVGRISVSAIPQPSVPTGVHTIEPALEVRKGDEIGIFHLGSTAVVLLEPGLTLARQTGPIRYGESLLRAA
jgi:phosphatidylserine decarboxylase